MQRVETQSSKDLPPPVCDEGRRSARIAWSSVAGAAGHATGVLVGLALVPLVIGHLGSERFGAWAALASLIGCLRMFDLGIANGLTNSLARAIGTGEGSSARRWIAAAAAALAAVASIAALLMAVAWGTVDWAKTFGLSSATGLAEIGSAVAIAFALFAMELPLLALERIFGAVGAGIPWNVWLVAGHLGGLLASVVVLRAGGGLPALVAAGTGARLLALAGSGAWLFVVRRPELRPSAADVERRRIRELIGMGRHFFILQAAALILYNTDNLIIARVLGAEQVTAYTVAWRLFMIPPAAMAVVSPYLWPAYVEALARGETGWVVRTVRTSVYASTLLALLLAVPLVVVGQPLIGRWAGEAAIPSLAVLVWMGAWSVILSVATAVACFLNAAGRVGVQAAYGMTGSLLNIGVTIWWAHRFGTSGVIAATVVSYAVAVLGPSLYMTRRTLREVRGSSLAGSRAGA
jgi:O-antigen/teichoic acid export membrane protein